MIVNGINKIVEGIGSSLESKEFSGKSGLNKKVDDFLKLADGLTAGSIDVNVSNERLSAYVQPDGPGQIVRGVIC